MTDTVKYDTLQSIHRVWVVMRDDNLKPISVHIDGSEARVKLIYTEEETKQPHHLQRAHLLIENRGGLDEDVYAVPTPSYLGGE